MAHAEVHRSGQLDRAARHDRGAARLLLGLVEVGKELHRALVEGAAAFGEADAAGRAVQQPRLQMRLELRDMPGSGRGGEIELVRCAGKAAGLHHLSEHPQGLKTVH